jgi:SAM-dependent methyltransferase
LLAPASGINSLGMTDARRQPPAMMRNREPILRVLKQVLPSSGLVLEIASGSGGHAAWCVKHLGGVDWQPSEVTLADGAADSINAWANWAATGRMRPAIQLDVEQTEWPIAAADAIVCINMVHISPWQTTKGLLAGAARILDTGGVLYLYGPYLVEGTPTAAGNLAFDEDLRRRNPEWGLRTLEAVAKEAAMHGLVLEGTHAMPSNNLSVVFRRQVS